MKNGRIYGHVALLLLALFSFTPFIIGDSIPDGIIEGKNIYFNVVFFVAAALSSCLLLFYKGELPRPGWMDLGMLLLVLFLLIFNGVLHTYLQGPVTSIFLSYIAYFVIRLCLHWVRISKLEHWGFILILLAGLMQAIWGLLQLYGVLPGMHALYNLTGSFHNPGPYSIYLAILFPLTLGIQLFLVSSGKAAQILKYLAAVLCVAIIILLPATGSRTAWIGAAVGSLLLLNYKYGLLGFGRFRSFGKYLIVTASITLVLGCLYTLYQFKQGSADGRAFIWQVSKGIIQERPLTGIGFNGMEREYANYQARYFAGRNFSAGELQLADNPAYVFNDFLQLAVEEGIFVLLLYLAIAGYFLYTFLSAYFSRQLQPAQLGVGAALLTGWVCSLFSYPMQLISIQQLLIALLAYGAMDKLTLKEYLPRNRYPLKVAAVCIVTLCGVFIANAFRDMNNRTQWKEANDIMESGDYATAIKQYQQCYPSLQQDGKFLLRYGKALAITSNYKESIRILDLAKAKIGDQFLFVNQADNFLALHDYGQAIQHYQHAIEMVPNRMYPRYLLAKAFVQSKDTLNAVKTASYIVDMQEKIVSPATMQMKSEMKSLLLRLQKRIPL